MENLSKLPLGVAALSTNLRNFVQNAGWERQRRIPPQAEKTYAHLVAYVGTRTQKKGYLPPCDRLLERARLSHR